MSTESIELENERLKASADDIYGQLADNPGMGIPVDPEMIDFLGIPESPDQTDDGDIQVVD